MARASISRVLAAGAAGGALVVAACSVATSFDGLACTGSQCVGQQDGSAPDANNGAIIDAISEPEPTDAPPVPKSSLGDGHSGTKDVVAGEVVNSYSPLAIDVLASATSITISAPGPLADGDLVAVWQVVSNQDVVVAPAVDLSAYSVGNYELVHATHVYREGGTNSAVLALESPLAHDYFAHGTQVIRVPEYTDVNIGQNGVISALPWDGQIGGAVMFLATGTLTIDGAIKTDMLGFRGGVTYQNAGPYNCTTQPNGAPVDGYAAKGEGIVISKYQAADAGNPATAPGGRGVEGNGAGGGHCHNAGGGGGGNGGPGGQGGRCYDGNADGGDVGGLGGSALVFSVKDKLLPGGGGGSGDRHAGIDTTGGIGGGVILVRANGLIGDGSISANGGTSLPTDHDGVGGGGAGGTIALFIATSASCAQPIRALGGMGGSTTMSQVGPGGGGGGGHVLLSAATSNCTFDVSAGVAGVQANANAVNGPQYGAAPLGNGATSKGVVEPP